MITDTNTSVPTNECASVSNRYAQALLRFTGIDRAIGMVLLSRVWSFVAGPLTLICIGRFLRPEEQGYYYTFNSVIALNVFFELGLSYVLVQCVSHEWAYLQWTPTRLLAGPPKVKCRLAAIVTTAFKWYATAAIAVCACILPIGLFFFQHAGHDSENVVWRFPWTWLVFASALNLYVNALLAVLEGCGKIAEISTTRAVQSIIANVVLWVALTSRCALLACPIYQTVMIAIPAMWLYVRYRRFFLDLLGNAPTITSFSWRREVWPFQWRIAVSWVSGYFIFQLFNPILFAFRGPAEAGRMGMTVSVVGTLQALSISWMSTKAAPFGVLISTKQFQKLDRVFFRCLAQSLGVCAAGGAVAFLAIIILRMVGNPLSQRLLDPLPFGMLLCAAVANHVIFAESIYLRAHKEEPFLITSVLGALAIGVSTFVFGRRYGALGIATAYLVLTLSLGLCVNTWIFTRKRRLWHGLCENKPALKSTV